MGFFNNLFGNNKKQNNKLSDLLIDYSLKFNNAILSSYDTSQIDQTYLNNLKLESYAFTYQVIDRLLYETFDHEKEKYMNLIDANTSQSFLDRINYDTSQTEFSRLINERQYEYSQFEFITNEMTNTIYWHFGNKITPKTLSQENVMSLVTSIPSLTEVNLELMKDLPPALPDNPL
jgi:hypothetical protein